ncbi:MAG: NAD(P)/FAD-dependent oxidoreductase [Candidatus Bipolaricaulota bacterium]
MNPIESEKHILDLAIVGCGPAGLSAAVNLAATNTEFEIFGSTICSPKMHKAPKVNNYLGFYDITGEELRRQFLDHTEQVEIQIHKEKIDNIYPQRDFYTLVSRETLHHAYGVILAVGTASPNYIKGEEQYLGRGVSYCATCDGPLFADRNVAIIAHSEEAVHEAEQMAEIADKVYFIPQLDRDISLPSEIEIVEGKPKEIQGDKMVHSLQLEKERLEVDGVFVIRSVTPPDKLIDNIGLKDGHIAVDEEMRTNLERIYAAGDCTGTPYQLARAVGQGQVAALSARRDVVALH